MTDLRFLLSLSLAAPLALSACNLSPRPSDDDDDAADDDDTGSDDDDDTGTGDPVLATIAELTGGDVAAGTIVRVEGAVVTTPTWDDDEANEGMFWIQDDTGPGNGILVFTFPDVLTESGVWASDEVTVVGEFDVPFGFPEIKLSTAADITVTGDGTAPAPHPVDAADLQGGFADTLLYGVLVEVQDLVGESAGGYDNYWEWEASGVIFDSLFYYADVEEGYTIDSVVGVVHLDYGNAKVHPRWGSDVQFTYPGCDAAADGDIQDVNCRQVDENSDVELAGMVVISPAPWYGNAFYVSDPEADGFGGAVVYSFDDITPPAVGAVVDVSGEYEEYRGNTEIVVDAAGFEETGDSVDLEPIVLASACDIGEEWEGMLVSVAQVVVEQSADGEQYGYYEISACPERQIGSEFFGSEDFGTVTGGPGTIEGLVGIVVDKLDTYTLNPRDEFDWDSWGTR